MRGELAERFCSRTWDTLAQADTAINALDGTGTKSRLGANAITGCSLSLARALAHSAGQELHNYLAPAGCSAASAVPHFNVLNGGAHAVNPLDFQEFMIVPIGAPLLPGAIRAGAEVYAALRKRLHEASHTAGLGDEGGCAP